MSRVLFSVIRPMRGAGPFDWLILALATADLALSIAERNELGICGWSLAITYLCWPRSGGRRSIASVLLLAEVARRLRTQGVERFRVHGVDDPRGAALWDAGCYVDPFDHDGLGVAFEGVS